MTTRCSAMAVLVRRTWRVGGIVCGLLILASLARGENWSPLEEYVQQCVLITKARATVLPPSSPNAPVKVELRMLEVWKGHFEADTFGSDCLHPGVYRAYLEEHGLHVVDGQEVILFFTRHNQPDPDHLTRHSTAFPIRDGKLIYAKTSNEYYQEYTVEEFEKAVRGIEARDRSVETPQDATTN